MPKEKIKTQKGITLIALIITIIIMLILVGVTVSVSLNGGLFSTAKQATNETEIAAEKERLLSIAMGAIGNDGKVVYDELDTAIAKDGTFEGTGGTYTSKKTEKIYTVNEYGDIQYAATSGTIIGDSDTDTASPSQLDIQYTVSEGKITFTTSVKGKTPAQEWINARTTNMTTEDKADLFCQLSYGYDSLDDYANAEAESQGGTAEEIKNTLYNSLLLSEEIGILDVWQFARYYRMYLVYDIDCLGQSIEDQMDQFVDYYISTLSDTELETQLADFNNDLEAFKEYLVQQEIDAAVQAYGENCSEETAIKQRVIKDYYNYCDYDDIPTGTPNYYPWQEGDYRFGCYLNDTEVGEGVTFFSISPSYSVKSGDVIVYGVSTDMYGERGIMIQID